MQILKPLITVAILMMWASSAIEQDQRGSAPIRNRVVNGITLNQVAIVNAATHIFHAAQTPGGIATKSICGPSPIFDLAPHSDKLGDLFDSIVSADPTYRWKIDSDVPNLTQFTTEETLLDVIISRLSVDGEQTEDFVVNVLLKSVDIEKAVMNLQLQEGRTEIGLRPLERPGSPQLERKRFDIHLRDVTLRTALNTVARQHGTAVWRYDETRCNNTHEFSLAFLVW